MLSIGILLLRLLNVARTKVEYIDWKLAIENSIYTFVRNAFSCTRTSMRRYILIAKS